MIEFLYTPGSNITYKFIPYTTLTFFFIKGSAQSQNHMPWLLPYGTLKYTTRIIIPT